MKELKTFNELYNSIFEQIETYNDKPGPPGGNNIKYSDAGSQTGNQWKFSTDPGSQTGNQWKYSTDPGSLTGNCTGKSQTNEQVETCAGAGITTTSALGPATPAQSQANFCTANQHIMPHHEESSGINTSDIKQIYHPCLPFKKIKAKKIIRKYPLFSRFK